MDFDKQVFEIDAIKLSEAMTIASDYKNATEELLASAHLTIRDYYNKISTALTLVDLELKDRIRKKQVQNTIFTYLAPDGEGAEVLTETVTHTSVDLAGIHKDAQAQVSASFSDPVYEELFTPTIRGSKAKAIQLAQEGRLPNATKRVKTTTITQVKLFDISVKEE